MTQEATLAELYQRTSKHSHYQVLAAAVAPLLPPDAVRVQSRWEPQRLAYLLQKLPVQHWCVADVGGNTGYFSFELLARGAAHVDYYEGNGAHHDFVRAAAARLGLSQRLHAQQRYLSFTPGEMDRVDLVLLLNVLHHLGDDFGDPATAKDAACRQMLHSLAALAPSTRWLAFQLGFNWKGDRHLPLFERGSKSEMIDFVRSGTAHDWDIEAIGVAERDGEHIVYRDLSQRNAQRDDSLGEFLNRPLFVMRSRHHG